MKANLIFGGIVSAALLCSPLASAEENKTAGSGPNPYRDCGIGGAIFQSVGWAAVTSNVIWDLGTTAITSATASPQTCNGKTLEAAVFIRDTYDTLVEETAAGNGEHVTSLLNIFECDNGDRPLATTAIRSSVAELVSDPSYVQKQPLQKASDFYDAAYSAVSYHCAS